MISRFESKFELINSQVLKTKNVIGTASVAVHIDKITEAVFFSMVFNKTLGKSRVTVTLENFLTSESRTVVISHSGITGKKLDKELFESLSKYTRLDYGSFKNLFMPVLGQIKEAFAAQSGQEQSFITALSLHPC